MVKYYIVGRNASRKRSDSNEKQNWLMVLSTLRSRLRNGKHPIPASTATIERHYTTLAQT